MSAYLWSMTLIAWNRARKYRISKEFRRRMLAWTCDIVCRMDAPGSPPCRCHHRHVAGPSCLGQARERPCTTTEVQGRLETCIHGEASVVQLSTAVSLGQRVKPHRTRSNSPCVDTATGHRATASPAYATASVAIIANTHTLTCRAQWALYVTHLDVCCGWTRPAPRTASWSTLCSQDSPKANAVKQPLTISPCLFLLFCSRSRTARGLLDKRLFPLVCGTALTTSTPLPPCLL